MHDRKKAEMFRIKNGGPVLDNMSTTEIMGKIIKAHDPYAINQDWINLMSL